MGSCRLVCELTPRCWRWLSQVKDPPSEGVVRAVTSPVNPRCSEVQRYFPVGSFPMSLVNHHSSLRLQPSQWHKVLGLHIWLSTRRSKDLDVEHIFDRCNAIAWRGPTCESMLVFCIRTAEHRAAAVPVYFCGLPVEKSSSTKTNETSVNVRRCVVVKPMLVVSIFTTSGPKLSRSRTQKRGKTVLCFLPLKRQTPVGPQQHRRHDK